MDWIFEIALVVAGCGLSFWLGRWYGVKDEAKKIRQMAPLFADAIERDLLALSELSEQIENVDQITKAGFRFEPDATYIDAIVDQIHLFGPDAAFVVNFHQQVKTFKRDIDKLNAKIRAQTSAPDYTGVQGTSAVIRAFDEKAREVKVFVTKLRRWHNN